jgi:hypothetical protein
MARPGVSTRSRTRATVTGAATSRGRIQKAPVRRRRHNSHSPPGAIENRGTDGNATQSVTEQFQVFQRQIEDLRNQMAARTSEGAACQPDSEARFSQNAAPQLVQSSTQFAAPSTQFAAPATQFVTPATQSVAPATHFASSHAQAYTSLPQPTSFANQLPPLGSVGMDMEGEQLPTLAHNVSRCHPALPRPLILAIFRGKFHPKDLCKFRLLHGQNTERSEEIVIIGGKMLLKKRTGELKDFGSTPSIWSYGFLNYTSTMNEFFGNSSPGLTTALLAFHTTIMMLSEVYPWYGCILNLAIEYHQWISEAEQGPTTTEYWRLPVEWKDRYTQSAMKLASSSKPAAFP